MKIEEIGGEFPLIDRLASMVPAEHKDLIVGIGDDAAVIRTAPEPAPYLLVSTDILVEERHFRCQWSQPDQIGIKAAESNISDIAAMGGRAGWMFVSLVLREGTDVNWAENLYEGLNLSCQRHGVVVAGGDTSQGPNNTINITIMGNVSPDNLCLRSHARVGDRLMVTGHLGGSGAALALLNSGATPSDYLSGKHLTPTCRLDAVEAIAPLANAMIDISDGLGSEVHHICNQSQVGAEVNADTIPLHDDVIAAGETLGVDPIDFALSGGEDYELLFSISEENLARLDKTEVTCYPVGRIVEKKGSPVLAAAGGMRPLPGGYNHFK